MPWPGSCTGWACQCPAACKPADALTQSINGNPNVWRPSARVPLGSQDVLGMIDNAPSLAAWLQALRRPGLF